MSSVISSSRGTSWSSFRIPLHPHGTLAAGVRLYPPIIHHRNQEPNPQTDPSQATGTKKEMAQLNHQSTVNRPVPNPPGDSSKNAFSDTSILSYAHPMHLSRTTARTVLPPYEMVMLWSQYGLPLDCVPINRCDSATM